MRTADVIFVLHHGQLQELGSHDQLLAKKGIYAALYRRQKLEYELHEEQKAQGN
jgi:ATP-binding cassette subfamily B protein